MQLKYCEYVYIKIKAGILAPLNPSKLHNKYFQKEKLCFLFCFILTYSYLCTH